MKTVGGAKILHEVLFASHGIIAPPTVFIKILKCQHRFSYCYNELISTLFYIGLNINNKKDISRLLLKYC